MAVRKMQLVDTRQKSEEWIGRLEKELDACTEVARKSHVRDFMIEHGIQHISELNYTLRKQFENRLKPYYCGRTCREYLLMFDRIKQHSIREQWTITVGGKIPHPAYRHEILYLPYYPEPEVMERFRKSVKREALIWDFSIRAPEIMKRQMHWVLCEAVHEKQSDKSLIEKLSHLQVFYGFCCREVVEDIEQMELCQVKRFQASVKQPWAEGIVDYCREKLFLQSDSIPWEAPVWYMERFHLQPERVDPSYPIKRFSFLEVSRKDDRKLLQRYMRYLLGVTNLSMRTIHTEFTYVRNFAIWMDEPDSPGIGSATPDQMDQYFKTLQRKKLQAASYNDQVMAILHFFNFLVVRRYRESVPFSEELYLQKEIPVHHNRSVEAAVVKEIMGKLYRFPEDIRLMYLHLWAAGLRISEVCALKGNAYFLQAQDTFIQVYQNKMKSYKKIPIPAALYELMQVYLKKHSVKPNEYLFQNSQGGPYRSATFRWKMIRCCKENGIQHGEYIFRSHDYRHSIATEFYNREVSIQSIRDYLGHTYEEMTRQYIDYMPQRIDRASENYFSRHPSLAASISGKEEENGQ